MHEIIKKLKNEIINHNLIKNSSLSSSSEWKRAHYIVLSDMISEGLSKSEFMQGSKKNDLGVTISSSTLQRIFAKDYDNKKSNDLRFLKTLDKLAIFLGYPNLNNFLLYQSQDENKNLKKDELVSVEDNTKPTLSFFKEIVMNSCQEYFELLKKLPVFDMGGFSKHVFEESSVYKRVYDLNLKYSELKYHLNCENNRSNFEVYGFKLQNINEDSAVIGAKEFWNLDLVDTNGKNMYLINEVTRQLYFFKKINGVWKIWDNHNPAYDTLAEDFLKTKDLKF